MDAIAPCYEQALSRLDTASAYESFRPLGKSSRNLGVHTIDADAFHKDILYHKYGFV
jgi:hypothetical protein